MSDWRTVSRDWRGLAGVVGGGWWDSRERGEVRYGEDAGDVVRCWVDAGRVGHCGRGGGELGMLGMGLRRVRSGAGRAEWAGLRALWVGFLRLYILGPKFHADKVDGVCVGSDG